MKQKYMKLNTLALGIACLSITGSAHAGFFVIDSDPPEPQLQPQSYSKQSSPLPAQKSQQQQQPQQTSLPQQPVALTNPAPVHGVATAIPESQASAKRLPPIEQKRLDALREWERSGVAEALVGQNGSIEFPYGYSRPVIACAPLHICTIILQPGEAITSLSIGDTVRWLAQQSVAGTKPVIVVKPTQAAISTNMVVTTDAGRVYYMHLVADKSRYVPIVSFYDPANMMQQEQSAISAAESARIAAEARAKAFAEKRDQETIATFKPGFDPAKLDFNYRCRGNDEDLLPARVFSTETHTYLQMPSGMKAKDAPAIFALRGEQTELVNMRVKGDYYVVDGKPTQFRLLVGVGPVQSAVTCERK
jgi:type IV secretion system protein VirB9